MSTALLQGIHPLRSYLVHLLPQNCDLPDPETLADEGLLPTLRVKAANATHAEAVAHLASGKRVLRADRSVDVVGQNLVPGIPALLISVPGSIGQPIAPVILA